jgi:aquaglyceroporin related protein
MTNRAKFIGTFILLLVVFAVSDGRRKNPLSPGLVPLVVFIAILGIAVAFGMQTGTSPFIIFRYSLID